MGAARPKDDAEDDNDGGDSKDSPGNFTGRVLGKIFSAGANVLSARELQFGEFLDRWWRRGLRLHGHWAGFRAAAALVSPFAERNAVDHTLYDHTSILRFLFRDLSASR